MKKKGILLALVLVLVVSLVAACAKPAPAPAPAPVPAPSAEVFQWKLYMETPIDWETNVAGPMMCEEIAGVTNDRLQITLFYEGEHPYKQQDMLPVIQNRECELTLFALGKLAGIEPRTSLLDLPMLMPGGDFEAYRELAEGLARDGFYRDVFAEWNVQQFLPFYFTGQNVYMTDTFLEDWDSFKGKKVRGWTVPIGDLITLLNGDAVTIDFKEVYHALQTGLIDGLLTGLNAAYGAKLFEVVKRGSMINYMFSYDPWVVNKDAWAELPSDVKNEVNKYLESKWDFYALGRYYEDGLGMQDACMLYGVQWHPVPPALIEEIRGKAYEGIWKKWMDRSGPEAAEAFNSVAKEILARGISLPGYTPH